MGLINSASLLLPTYLQSTEFEDIRDKLRRCKNASILKVLKFSNKAQTKDIDGGKSSNEKTEPKSEATLTKPEPAPNETIIEGRR